jgi:hypothetical protein
MPTEPPETTGRKRPRRHEDGGRWELPLFSLALGVVVA